MIYAYELCYAMLCYERRERKKQGTNDKHLNIWDFRVWQGTEWIEKEWNGKKAQWTEWRLLPT